VAGGVAAPGTFVFHGIEGVKITLSAGISVASQDNEKVKIEIPVKMTWPIPPSPATGGIPLAVQISMSFLVSTALTGNNTTMQGSGEYRLTGPIGIRNGEAVSPTLSVEHGILDSLGGIMLGPSGIVVATKIKAQVGIGMQGVVAGPHMALTTSLGVTHGSSLGAPLATCRSGTLTLTVAGGVGISISGTLQGKLAQLFGEKWGGDLGIETSTEVFKRSVIDPDVPLCSSGT
jgi:hypothetical protein